MVSVESSVVVAAYEEVGPYSTCELAASSVVHVVVAFVAPGVPNETEEITGGVVSAGDELPPPPEPPELGDTIGAGLEDPEELLVASAGRMIGTPVAAVDEDTSEKMSALRSARVFGPTLPIGSMLWAF